MAHLLRDVAVLLIEAHVFERLALGGNARAVRGPAPGNRLRRGSPPTSIGLNGFAMRPIVDE